MNRVRIQLVDGSSCYIDCDEMDIRGPLVSFRYGDQWNTYPLTSVICIESDCRISNLLESPGPEDE